MNVIDWLRESAAYMASTRPEVYTHESALEQLTSQMEELRTKYGEVSPAMLMSGGFILIRLVVDEGIEEFQLAQLVSGAATFFPEEDVMVYRGIVDIDLPHITDAFPHSAEEDGDNFFFGES